MPSLLTLAGDCYEPDLPGRLLSIAGDIRSAGGRAFLVGGWVRDALLGKDCRDYDIEVYDSLFRVQKARLVMVIAVLWCIPMKNFRSRKRHSAVTLRLMRWAWNCRSLRFVIRMAALMT